MAIYDIMLVFDQTGEILDVRQQEGRAAVSLQEILHSKELKATLTDGSVSHQKQIELLGEVFDCEIVRLGKGYNICLLKAADQKNYLYEAALECLGDGVQVYDKNGYAVYYNKRSREISQIPLGLKIEGEHVLDIYNLDEEISTTMTCLRTGAPVVNRFDNFTSEKGVNIISVNTAYPIFHQDQLMGAVVFEMTEDVVEKEKQRLEDIRHMMEDHQRAAGSLSAFSGYTFDSIIGSSKSMKEAVSLAKKIAPLESNVLLLGETGTGKEIFAQSIHKGSRRSGKRFVALNCAAVPETLVESLLFGTQKGSFTGSENKKGYFEEANEGTLFLDELNSMSLSMQSKILRAIQEKKIRRVGGQEDIPIDVRIISSCNENPFELMNQNLMRKDLFYRLCSAMVELPPLRERPEDVEELAEHFINSQSYHYAKKIEGLSPEALTYLKKCPWTGNVRELFHVLEYMMNVAGKGMLDLSHLPSYMKGSSAFYPGEREETFSGATKEKNTDRFHQTLQEQTEEFESRLLREILDYYGGHITKTAEVLGIKRQSLQYRIRKYGIIL